MTQDTPETQIPRSREERALRILNASMVTLFCAGGFALFGWILFSSVMDARTAFDAGGLSAVNWLELAGCTGFAGMGVWYALKLAPRLWRYARR